MNIGHVQGGTNAGWRKVKQPKMWTHRCPQELRNVAGADVEQLVLLTTYSCTKCGHRRPVNGRS